MITFSKRMIEKPDIVITNTQNNDKQSSTTDSTLIVSSDTNHETVADDDMAKDLAMLVGNAITIWAKKYGLENLPKDIILDQAISIMMTAKDSIL